MPDPVIAVLGPTAAGKSDLALRLARELGGEIINADSMQLYRGMDIGTAKLTVAERAGVPHHLLDIWDVTEAAAASEYQGLAPTPACAPGWRSSWPGWAPRSCTPGWPVLTRPPRLRSCPATAVASCGRWRSSS